MPCQARRYVHKACAVLDMGMTLPYFSLYVWQSLMNLDFAGQQKNTAVSDVRVTVRKQQNRKCMPDPNQRKQLI